VLDLMGVRNMHSLNGQSNLENNARKTMTVGNIRRKAIIHWRAYKGRFWTQWSFHKTGTMGALASQAETDAWVQAPGTLLQRHRGFTSRKKKFTLYMKNTAIWCIFLALLNTLTMGNDPCSGPLRNLVSGSVGVCSKDPPTPLPKQVCYSEY